MTSNVEDTTIVKPPSRVGAWVRRNPIALKELRGRMRGSRAFVVLTVYVGLMSLFTALLYLIYTGTVATTATLSGGVVGKLIFAGVFAIELFLVCFVAPAFTAGAISGERERRTYHLLRTTLLSANRIVIGKLLSALAYIVLLLLVAVPLQSLAFLMGGITIEEVVLSVEILLVTAIAYGAMGIFFSALTKRTLTASILTYTVALITTVALPLGALVIGAFSPFGLTNMRRPFWEGLLTYLFGLVTASNPVSTAIVTETTLLQRGSAFYFTQILSNGASIPLVSPWVAFTVIYLLITVVLVAVTVRRVRQVEE